MSALIIRLTVMGNCSRTNPQNGEGVGTTFIYTCVCVNVGTCPLRKNGPDALKIYLIPKQSHWLPFEFFSFRSESSDLGRLIRCPPDPCNFMRINLVKTWENRQPCILILTIAYFGRSNKF